MQVEILKQTHFEDSLLPGDVIDVDDSVAKRWFKNGIAQPFTGNASDGDASQDVQIDPESIETDVIVESTGEEISEQVEVNLDEMDIPALRVYAKENGINLSGVKKEDRGDQAKVLAFIKEAVEVKE